MRHRRTEYRQWYGTARWKKIRAAVKAAEPLCRLCLQGGLITPATTADHVNPHRGDEAAFWAGPFQALCTPCHNGTKQWEERGQPVQRLAADGWPEV